MLSRTRNSCVVAGLALLLGAACEQGPATGPDSGQLAPAGNGAPSGAHYTLNIIGVALDKKEDFDAPNDNGIGNRIFVRLNHDDGSQDREQFGSITKINKILLAPGDAFAVLDANATDSDGASFQLPADVSTTYEVYARPLGSPKGNPSVTMTTCAEDPDTGEVICSTENTVQMRTKGKSTFENVSQELLTANVSVDPDDNPDLASCLGLTVTGGDDPVQTARVNLFDACLQNYFWDYDNNGLRLLQLRFYPV